MIRRTYLILAFLLIGSVASLAQTKVTFRVNLQPMLADSSFVPGRDVLEVSGNLTPFTPTKRFELKDEKTTSESDSVYSVVINFPRRLNGQSLNYTFIIRSKDNLYKEKKEAFQRTLNLSGSDYDTRPLLFDTYAY